tara:strand:+ start:5852 stop:6547 length:696 start_codon:yes stop_codon:yes gene_type:complete
MMAPYAHWLMQFYNHTEEWHNDPDKTRAAIIVESRPDFWLDMVVGNFRQMLDESWNLYHVNPRADDFWIDEYRAGNPFNMKAEEYNRLLRQPAFWEHFNEDTLLIFQVDCVALRPLTYEDTRFALIGAPCGELGDAMIYNGGLSVRDRLTSREAALADYSAATVEDVYFTETLRKMGVPLPTEREAAAFALESVWLPGSVPFGVHGTDKYYHSPLTAQNVLAHATHGGHGP